MKLIKERYETYAREQGYESGADMYDDMGLNRGAYEHYRNEVPINGQTLRILCWNFGTVVVMDFVSLTKIEQERYQDILDEF